MVDQITFQTISIMIAAATVVIGVINSIISGRREEKQRQEQLILQRFQGYGLEYTRSYSEVMNTRDWKTAEEFDQKYGGIANPDFNSKLIYIMGVWRLAGVSLKRGADPDLIFELYQPDTVIRMWEQYEPVIKERRESLNNPILWESLEFLYKEARKRSRIIRSNPSRNG